MQNLAQTAIKAGVSLSDFWSMTVSEVILVIEAWNEREEERIKTQLGLNYALAQNIALAIGSSFSGQQMPGLYELYPELFSNQDTPKVDNSWQLYKEQFIDFANRHNQKRGEKD